MPFVPNEKITDQIAEQIKITDVAQAYGLTLVSKGDTYSTVEHDSVVIYPETNSYYRHSTHQGGNVFRFVKEIFGIGFTQFYFDNIKKIDRSIEPHISSFNGESKPKKVMQINKNTFNLNESLNQVEQRENNLKKKMTFDFNNRNVKAYLIQTRKIRPDVVDEFINKGLVRQGIDKIGHKVAYFLGYNDVGYLSAVNVKSVTTGGKFKGDLSGCNYAYGWRYDPDINDYTKLYHEEFYNADKPLICFEGYIDMMAFISTLKDKGIDYKQYSYITCGSTTKYKSVIAACKTTGYSKIKVAFDNDKSGELHAQLLAKDLTEELGEGNFEIKRLRSHFKDWDDDRQYLYGDAETKEKIEQSFAESQEKLNEWREEQKEKKGELKKKKGIEPRIKEAQKKMQEQQKDKEVVKQEISR